MQKSGIKFLNVLPQTIVPLDSAFINLLYTIYSTAFSAFLQAVSHKKNQNTLNHFRHKKTAILCNTCTLRLRFYTYTIYAGISIFYTRRTFFGLHPLCGIRVVSVMDCTIRPAFANPRTADSRP